MAVEFLVLGPVEIRVDDVAVAVTRERQRLLLATLLVARRQVVSMSTLVDVLWHGQPPPSATGVVQNQVSLLRKLWSTGGGPPLLQTDGTGYRLVVRDDVVDAVRFEQLAGRGQDFLRNGAWAEAERVLAEAMRLWRGPAYGDIGDEPAIQPEARRLNELRLGCLEDRIEADIGLGRHRDVVGELEALVAHYPFRERSWGQLMRCLYAAGRQADALHAYQRLRRLLGDELGLEPGPELTRLEAEILAHAPSLTARSAAPPATDASYTVVAPTGTVTFLFAEVADSFLLWERSPREAGTVLASHDALVRAVIADHRGYVFTGDEDRLGGAFADANDAVAAALATVLLDATSTMSGRVQLRIGLHTGSAELRDGHYLGAAVNCAARVAAAAGDHQVLVTSATASRIENAEWTIADLGEHRLRGLDRPERLYRLHAAGMTGADTTLAPMAERVGNLPRRPLPLIGRDGELARLAEIVQPGQLVTVTGPPGVGKTSLALVAANGAARSYADGAWLIELAASTTLDDVVSVVVTALGLFVASGKVSAESMAAVVGDQERLIVLDNCEHVLDAANEVVAGLLGRCPRVAILATSRERLGRGEQVLALAPLAVYAAAGPSDAETLFVDRLAQAGSSRELDQTDRECVAAICTRLDGVPLALELAAARAASIGLREVSTRLAASNYDLGRRPGRVERQRSLTSVVAWSYDLLSSEEQRVFERLALFADGFDLAAASAVCGFGLDSACVDEHVFSLIDKSLVTVQRSTPVRYRLLEVVRQFAERQLAARDGIDEAAGRLVAYYADWIADADAGLRGRDEHQWHAALASEWNNLRAVINRAVATDEVDAACHLVAHALWWGVQRERLELGDWAEAVFALPGADSHPLSPVVLSAAAEVSRRRNNWDQYRAYQQETERLEQMLGAAPDPWVPFTRFWNEAAHVDLNRLPCVTEIRHRAGGSPFWEAAAAWCDAFMPATRLSTGMYPESSDDDWRRVQRCHEAANALANPTWMARAANLLGAALRASDPGRAAAVLESGLALAQFVGNEIAGGEIATDLAMAYAEAGRSLDSVAVLVERMALARRAGARWGLFAWYSASFRTLVAVGRLDLAYGVVLEFRKYQVTDPWDAYNFPRPVLARIEAELGPAELARLAKIAEEGPLDRRIADVERVLVEFLDAAR
jgi:predicted ATPase/DNA-binding SARP family transcriptional activator